MGFLLNVRHAPEFEDRSDDELLALGRQLCASLDGGATYEQAVAPMLDVGVSPDSAMILASTAVFEFCGQHDRTIEVALGGPANPQPDPTGDPRQAFLAAAHANPSYGEATDEGLLMLGTTYCDGFTRGDTLDVSLGYMEPTPREDAMAMLTAAVTYICPEHANKLG